jgi:hypothetical protein
MNFLIRGNGTLQTRYFLDSENDTVSKELISDGEMDLKTIVFRLPFKNIRDPNVSGTQKYMNSNGF